MSAKTRQGTEAVAQNFNVSDSPLPFSADFFDGILLNNILEHLEKPDDAFSEIKRVLKNDGKLLIELPGKKGFYYDKTHVKFWGKDETISFLRENGFHDISSGYFPVPCAWAGDILTHNKLRVFARIKKEALPEQVLR
ncbi:MAG: methyltransferase domain-containing protein [Nitrospirota bacterium]|nr:methyltransferase domain-containing protein [Nitrospirota bacterium]